MTQSLSDAWNFDKAFRQQYPGETKYRCGCYSEAGIRWCSNPMTQEDMFCDDCRTDISCSGARAVYNMTHTKEERDLLYSQMLPKKE